MSLNPGTRLGPYEVLGVLGAGGMGEVYRVRDTRLDRIVALKVVRADFSERFEREAKAISALNHPHICSLYDVGAWAVTPDPGGTPSTVDVLVMELVDGQPVKGPMPVVDVLRYGRQIAEALDAAHKKGIVHRDLKPSNGQGGRDQPRRVADRRRDRGGPDRCAHDCRHAAVHGTRADRRSRG